MIFIRKIGRQIKHLLKNGGTRDVRQDAIDHKTALKKLWNGLNRRSRLGFISHLQPGANWEASEFHLTGIRFVDRIMLRFEDFGELEASRANVLEIGCGVGRFIRPLACRFKRVSGIDISEAMLKTARKYCGGLPNVELLLGDGASLGKINDESFDYCFSAGVFQHITHINIILSYIKEALRVLKPGGVFLFQFEGTRTETVGNGQDGARITATDLDNGLKATNFAICEISIDPVDPVRNVVVVIKKNEGLPAEGAKPSFKDFKTSERVWISGVYDDVATKTLMHERLRAQPNRLTFFD